MLLKRFVESLPECFWNPPGMRSGMLEHSNPNVFGEYLEILERFSNVPGKFGKFSDCTWNVCSTSSRTFVPERSSVLERCGTYLERRGTVERYLQGPLEPLVYLQ